MCSNIVLSEQTIVMFCAPDPIKKGTIREIYARVGNESFTRIILVLQSKINSGARGALKDLFSNKVELFQVSFIFCVLQFYTFMTLTMILS
jgi:hypothetical protein